MIPLAFAYRRARDVPEALRLLRECGPDAKLLAGGHSLIPMMKLRLATPRTLIDIGGIAGLDAIDVAAERVRIGALTTHAALASNALLQAHAPALAQAAGELGDSQVRNRGTIGGACAHGDPAADYPAVLLALDAEFALTGPGGTRAVAADGFFRGTFATALEAQELLTAVAFSRAPHCAYVKYPHPASGYAVVGAAVNLALDRGGIAGARVAFAGVGDAAFRARPVEERLRGTAVDDAAALAAACRGAASGAAVREDAFASAEYRAAMADVFLQRALARALQPA